MLGRLRHSSGKRVTEQQETRSVMRHGLSALKHKGGSSRRRHGKVARLIVALIFIVGGLSLIAYPYASNYLNEVEQSKVQASQQKAVDNASSEDLSEAWTQAEDFNSRVNASRVRVTDPFDPNEELLSDDDYQGTLNLAGDGVTGQIVIPSIDVDLPIYHSIDGDGMNHGVGHMPSTSLPIGGDSTHSVLAGHTGLPSAHIFDRLTELEVGDWFIIRVLGEDHAYRVISTEVVLPDQTDSLAIQDGRDLVTLVTCTPYGINTHRLLIHAERSEIPQEWLDMQASGSQTSSTLPIAGGLSLMQLTFIGIGIGVVVAVALFVLIKKRSARRLEQMGTKGDAEGHDEESGSGGSHPMIHSSSDDDHHSKGAGASHG